MSNTFAGTITSSNNSSGSSLLTPVMLSPQSTSKAILSPRSTFSPALFPEPALQGGLFAYDKSSQRDSSNEMDTDGEGSGSEDHDLEDKIPHTENGEPPVGTPGGDCKRLCGRHQRMADAGMRGVLQKSLDDLSPDAQASVTSVWSLFSSAPRAQRNVMLSGLLTICCPSQLSFLTSQLPLVTRIGDPFLILPREISLKVLGFLDAISVGRAAQVNRVWKSLADDDILWRRICEQHIERRCEKCGWGLPLAQKRRKKKENNSNNINNTPDPQPPPSSSPAPAVRSVEGVIVAPSVMPISSTAQPTQSTSTGSFFRGLIPRPDLVRSSNLASFPPDQRPPKRVRTNSKGDSSASGSGSPIISPNHSPPSSRPSSPNNMQHQQRRPTKPWKSVYCERLAIERNWRAGKCSVTVFSGHKDAITCMQVEECLPKTPFPIMMTGSWDRTVRIWNMDTGECVGIMRGHTRGVRALQFDSAKLITGSMDNTLKIWNWRTGECIRTLEGHRDGVICLCFDDQLLVSGSADSTIKVWDFKSGECYTLRGHREWVNSVKLWTPPDAHNNNQHSSSPFANNDYDANFQERPSPSSSGNDGPHKLLFSGSDDMTVRVWDLRTRECIRVLEGHVGQIQSLKVLTSKEAQAVEPMLQQSNFNSPSTSVASSTRTSPPSTSAGRGAADPLGRNRSQVTCGNSYNGFFDTDEMDACTNSNSLLSGSEIGLPPPLRSRFLAAAEQPPPPPGSLAPLEFTSISGVKPIVMSASLDNTLKLWDVEGGRCEKTLFGHIEGVWAIDVDGLRMVSGSHDKTVKIWERDTGRCMHTLVGHTAAVTCVHLGDDKVVTGSDDKKIRIWSFAAPKSPP